MSKGSGRRPPKVAAEQVRSNWDRIFRRPKVWVCMCCENEVGGVGAGDEVLDYCHHCERIVEGNTMEKDK